MHPIIKHIIPYSILFFPLLWGWQQPLWGQQKFKALTLDDYVIKNYTRTDGLPTNLCTYTFCDSRGLIWIGSDEGLSIFDGNRFRKLFLGNGPVDLSGDRIVFITEDSQGQIWIVSTNSVDSYNPKTQTTRNYPFNPETNAAAPGFRSIFIKPGEPGWVFTTRGLFFLDLKTGRYAPYSAKMPPCKTFESNSYYDGWVFDTVKNQLWLGTYEGVACYDFKTRNLYNSANNPDKAAIFDYKPAKSSFKRSPGGTIYFVDGEKDSLIAYHPNSRVLKQYPLPEVYEKTLDYFAIHTPPDGSLWMGLRNSGVFVLDTLRNQYYQLSNSEKYDRLVNSNYIWHIANDYQGNIWVCHGMGAFVLAKQPLAYQSLLGASVINELSRLSRLEQVYADDKGNIWATANLAHLVMFDPQTGKHKNFKIPGNDSVSLSGILPLHKDKFILSGSHGLWEFDKITQRFRKLLTGKSNPVFRHASFRRKPILLTDGSMAFPEQKGIMLFKPETEKAVLYPYPFFSPGGNDSLSPTCLAPNGKGGILVGFATDKLSLFDWDLVSGKITALHRLLDTAIAKKIKPLIGAYRHTDGTLYITDRVFGFWKIDNELKRVRQYTRNDGMLTNIVVDFAPAENGDIWIQTFTGISCLRAATGKIESYEPGYPDMSSFYYAFNLDTLRKKLFISDANNIRIIDYPTFAPKVPFFKTGIIEIKVNGKRKDLVNGILPDLKYHENNITIDFGTFNYFPNAQTSIFYTLSNNPVPVPINGSRQINLTGLKSGKYTLTIEAIGQYEKKSTPIKVQFRILPAWYNTWWFVAICCIAGVLAIWYFTKMGQMKKLRELEYQKEIFRVKAEKLSAIASERERITADLHDDVGATLSSLNIYGDLAHTIWESNPKKSKEMVGKIAGQSRELMQRMSDIIWSMKEGENGSGAFTPRIRNFAQELLSGKDIEVKMDIDEPLLGTITNPMVRKNILLIIKEALNNAAKYSGATETCISVLLKEGFLVIAIGDNGKGFDINTVPDGNGLENMAARCRQMSGNFVVNTGPGKGTVITCKVPLAIISYSSNH